MEESRVRRLPEEEEEDQEEGERGTATQSNLALNEEKWEAMLGRLRAFKQQFGHTQIPYRYPADPQLGRWVSVQRSLYKRIEDGSGKSNTTLTSERIQKLNGIDFEWVARDHRTVPWEARYQELVAFVRRYGHSQVPIGWEDNVQLATWVSTQRQEYKLLKQGRSTRLTQHRISKLNQLNFVWDAKQRRGATSSPSEHVAPRKDAPANCKSKDKAGDVSTSERKDGKPKSHSSGHERSAKKRGEKARAPAGAPQLQDARLGPGPSHTTPERTASMSQTPAQSHDDHSARSVSLARHLLLQGEASSMNLIRPPLDVAALSQLDPTLSLPQALRLAQSRQRMPGGVDALNTNVMGSNQSMLSQLSQTLSLSNQSSLHNSLLDQANTRMAILSALQGGTAIFSSSLSAPLFASSTVPRQELLLSHLSSSRARMLLEQLVLQGRLSLSEHRLVSLLPPDQQLDIVTRLMTGGLDQNRIGGGR